MLNGTLLINFCTFAAIMTSMKKTTFDFEKGEIILVDKPLRWTSFDVVNKIRYATRVKKVGHAGTLDPLATGLLIICIGKAATKQIDNFLNDDKEYEGIFTLGATRPSYDMETDIDQHFDTTTITEAEILNAAQQLTGNINQMPPMYSAIKVDGKRLYESARKGVDIAVQARPVTIREFEITQINLPNVHFRIWCSKGTYIRSIAHDFGKLLNNGAYLSELRRTKSGSFSINDAWSLDELIKVLSSVATQK